MDHHDDVHRKIYDFFDELAKKFHPRDYVWDYRNNQPVPMLAFDDFLPEQVFKAIAQEYSRIPSHLWTEFTRNGSYMKECKDWSYTPCLHTLANCFNSGKFIDWLEDLTGHTKIISDPHYIGAGLSRTPTGQSLKLHTDFNWNDEIALNRCLSLILYVNPEWSADWGGALDFLDFDYKTKKQSITPMPNRLIIWDYDEKLLHGYPDPISCPADLERVTLRIFYYQSNSTPNSAPHRSLYWWDNQRNCAADDRSQT